MQNVAIHTVENTSEQFHCQGLPVFIDPILKTTSVIGLELQRLNLEM